MKEILQRSDFALKISFIDISGRNASVSRFSFSYYTEHSNPVVASFDGINYSDNCRLEYDGVVVRFDKPAFNVGQLFVKREYALHSSNYPDGEKNYTQIEALPIQITKSYSNAPLPDPHLPITVRNTGEVVFGETVVVEVIKGENGVAFDYSLYDEQLLPDQFAPDNVGQRKPLYGRRVSLSATVHAGGDSNNAYVYFPGIQAMSSLFDLSGRIRCIDWDRPTQSKVLNLTTYGVIQTELAYTADPTALAPLSLWLAGLRQSIVGSTLHLELFIKYTK